MAYATAEELAAALNLKVVTDANRPVLEACLEAAATEIDASLDRVEPLEDPAPDIIVRTNVNRAVEWYKAPDTANGGVGFDQIGSVETPRSGFGRHAAAILPLKQKFGVG
jgi:hypothetical protein